MHILFTLLISFIALLWAANHLVLGASGLAIRYNFSPLMTGLTIVAIGTSAPELFISLLSSLKHKNELTIGNAIGANIANIGLVLGSTILLKPKQFDYNTLKKAYPILFVSMLFVYSLIIDGYLGKIDGIFLLLACIGAISFFIHLAHRPENQDPFFKQFKSAINTQRSSKANILSVVLGLMILPISAKYLVLSAAEIARWWGVSELTIGLTIIAFGTTIPELATALTAAFKDEEEIAIGTILGANIYNFLLILSLPALINPMKVNSDILRRDMPLMMALTVLLFLLNFHHQKKLSSWEGGILLLVYLCYMGSLIVNSWF